MKIKLSNQKVKSIQLPKKGETFYWCTELIGFGVKATPTAKSYIVQARAGKGGRLVRHYIGRTNEVALHEAKNKAMKALATIRGGIDLNIEQVVKARKQQAQSLTLSQLFHDYVSKRTLRPRTKRTYEDAARLCIPDWCNMQVVNITRDMIEGRLQKIAEEPGVRGNRKAQAAQCFTLLRALFRFAADRYEVDGVSIIQSLPTKNIARGKAWSKISTRDIIISESGLEAWYQATETIDDAVLKDYIQFLMFSGMRRSECLKLKWTDIDAKNKVLTIPAENAKSGKKRQLPITDLLASILQRRHANRSSVNPFVFEGHKPGAHLVEPRRGVRIVREAINTTWTLHDLRRTYITHASRLIPYPALKALVGHSMGSASNDVTQRHYLRLDIESLKPEAQKVADWFKEKCKIKDDYMKYEDYNFNIAVTSQVTV